MCPAARRAPGFTLVELVLVISVIGILAAIGGPRFFRLGDFNERFFSDDTLGALRYAQKLAVVTGCDTQVDFSTTGFALKQRASCLSGTFSVDVAHPGNGAASYTGQAPSGVALSSSVDPLVFDALGRALDGGTVSDATVSVGARSIAVAGETGFARVP